MILDDFLDDRQAQAGAVLFTVADKRMKQPITNGVGHACAVVGNGDGDGTSNLSGRNFNLASHLRSRFAGVQEQVVKDALQLTLVKHAGTGSLQSTLIERA